MKEIILCTKKNYFAFERTKYIQTDDLAMGSSLGAALADIFMINVENSLLPNSTKYITSWKTQKIAKVSHISN